MSFGYSVGDVLAVIALANKIRKDFVGAPEQFKSISQDVRSLSIVIQDADANLDRMSDEHAANFNEILDSCQTLLCKLQGTISKWSIISDTSKGKAVQRLWKRLKWEPDEISDLRTQITSKITLLNAFNDQAISQNVAKLVRRNNDNEKQAMLDWISPIDYIPQQNHLVSRLQANSRRWLFDSAEYQKWEKQRGEVLFCPGDPGTGKTFTTAIVLETLQEQTQDNPDVLNTFVYCTYQAPDQDVHGLMSSLFRNSLQQAANIPDIIIAQCHRKRNAKQTLLRDETIKHLETLYNSFQKVNLLVDALDEVPTEVSRPFIAEILRLQKKCQLNLFVTSRHIPEIHNQFNDHGAVILEIRGSDKDIRQFLNDSIFQLPRFVARDLPFQREIIEKITEVSSGMFLLAELHLRSLKNKKSPKALRSSLAKLSVGSNAYDSAYRDAMSRIAGLGPESEALAKQALLILVFAREPLSTGDLVYALSIETDSDNIDEENVPDIEDVAGVCAGLVTIDKESNIVSLVHKSAQDYFERNQTELFPYANDTMARLCLTYLKLAISTEFDKSVVASRPPFWRYAEMNWAYHCHRTEDDNEATKRERVDFDNTVMFSNMDSVSTLAIGLLTRDLSGGLPSALYEACRGGRHGLVELLLTVNDYDLNRQPSIGSKESTTSNKSVWAENETTSDAELDGNSKRDSSDDESTLSDSSSLSHFSFSTLQDYQLDEGFHLLIMAVEKGDNAMARVLLSHGADPNLANTSGLTALFVAAEKGYVNTVSLLLEQPTINPDCKCSGIGKMDTWFDPPLRCTPLLAAAYHGHLTCVKLLLDRAQRNYKDERGRNVACFAAEHGNVQVLRELLKWSDIELDVAVGAEGMSALEIALRRSHKEAALFLIPYSDVNRVYVCGNRPLNLAARTGCLDTIQLLFSRHAKVNSKGALGQTILHNAAIYADKAMMELILSHADVDINIRDNDGDTPLMKLLLPRESDSGMMIPQTTRLCYHYKASFVINLLLSRPELDINIQNLNGDTALLIAASMQDEFETKAGESIIFNYLFYHRGIHREHRNNLGQTILVRAIMAGSQKVRIILNETQLMHQFSEVHANGETLLSMAARHDWRGQFTWDDIVDLSPPEFMHRKNSQGKTPEEVRNHAKSLKHRIRYTRGRDRRVVEANEEEWL